MHVRNIIVRYSFLFLLSFLLNGCIENDIPYPVIKMQVLQFAVDGQIGSAAIDTDNRVVSVSLEEGVDVRNVKINKLELTDGCKTDLNINTILDLSSPYKVTLSFYQDYVWTIIATQSIDRRFSVEGQIGSPVIEESSFRAIAYVSTKTDLKSISIKDLKLGPEGCTMSRTIEELSGSFIQSKKVNVSYHNKIENWTLYVFQKESAVTTEPADAWVNVAWLKGQGLEDTEKGFEYRQKGTDEWIIVSSEIKDDGGVFKSRLNNLQPKTTYEYRARSDEDYGEVEEFTTITAQELPNGSMDEWHKNGKVWNPWEQSGASFWDSGNRGATTLGESITTPVTDIWSGKSTGYAASLYSKFVGISSFGKFAAGNLFVGEYLRTDGTNGVLSFGKPYTSYPTKLDLYYKYTPAPIDNITEEMKPYVKANDPDTCFIYVALCDWDEPLEIRTKPSDRKLFNPNDPNVIAYAEFNSTEKITDDEKLKLELEYRATDRKPKYILVVCTASKYGDYFTGGARSLLHVDELNLGFDY